jgi:hypothetical protein
LHPLAYSSHPSQWPPPVSSPRDWPLRWPPRPPARLPAPPLPTPASGP